MQCPAKLREAARPVHLGRMGRAEDAVLVAVKGEQLAPFLQIGLCGMEIVDVCSDLAKRKCSSLPVASLMKTKGRIWDRDPRTNAGHRVRGGTVIFDESSMLDTPSVYRVLTYVAAMFSRR